jgi:hypothetical protein
VAESHRTALVVTTAAGLSAMSSGATQRLQDVIRLLRATGYAPHVVDRRHLAELSVRYDLGVAVSYASAPAVRGLAARSERVWLDAVDSWLLVNASGLRRGWPGYAARLVRDAAHLAAMPRVAMATWISAADLRNDHGTVRAVRRLVLPATCTISVPARGESSGTRIVLAGDWDYPPNHDGLVWFAREVVPLLSPSLRAQLAVYGPGRLPAGLPTTAHRGYATDEAELYQNGDVHVAPVRFGGGVKRKVVNPLSAGLPVVTTRAGAHGLKPHPLLDIRSSPATFAAAVADRVAARAQPSPSSMRELADQDDTAAVTAWLIS